MTPAPDATSPASQVGDDHGSFSQAKIPTALDAIMAAYPNWPDDVRQKLSLHDLRRMSGWRPALPAALAPEVERLRVAKSLAEMMIAWVDGAGSGVDWRTGLEGLILLRLERLEQEPDQ